MRIGRTMCVKHPAIPGKSWGPLSPSHVLLLNCSLQFPCKTKIKTHRTQLHHLISLRTVFKVCLLFLTLNNKFELWILEFSLIRWVTLSQSCNVGMLWNVRNADMMAQAPPFWALRSTTGESKSRVCLHVVWSIFFGPEPKPAFISGSFMLFWFILMHGT